MTLLIIAIIVVGAVEFWLYRKYTTGGIPLAVAIIVTQIAAVTWWRIVGPFGLLSRAGIILLALLLVILAALWIIAIRHHLQSRRQRRQQPAQSYPAHLSDNPEA